VPNGAPQPGKPAACRAGPSPRGDRASSLGPHPTPMQRSTCALPPSRRARLVSPSARARARSHWTRPSASPCGTSKRLPFGQERCQAPADDVDFCIARDLLTELIVAVSLNARVAVGRGYLLGYRLGTGMFPWISGPLQGSVPRGAWTRRDQNQAAGRQVPEATSSTPSRRQHPASREGASHLSVWPQSALSLASVGPEGPEARGSPTAGHVQSVRSRAGVPRAQGSDPDQPRDRSITSVARA
jgi:hypothetical protein